MTLFWQVFFVNTAQIILTEPETNQIYFQSTLEQEDCSFYLQLRNSHNCFFYFPFFPKDWVPLRKEQNNIIFQQICLSHLVLISISLFSTPRIQKNLSTDIFLAIYMGIPEVTV